MITLSYPAPKVEAADPITLNIGWLILQQMFGIAWQTESDNRNNYEANYDPRIDTEANYFMYEKSKYEGEYDESQVWTFDGVDYIVFGLSRYDIGMLQSALDAGQIFGEEWQEHLATCVPVSDAIHEQEAAESLLMNNALKSVGRLKYDEELELYVPTSCNNPDHAPVLPTRADGQLSTLGNWLKSKVSNILDDYSLVQHQPDVRDAILKYGKLTMTKRELLNLLEIFEQEFGYIGGTGDIIDIDMSDRGQSFLEQSHIEYALNGDFTTSYGTNYIRVPNNFLTSGLYLQLYSGGGPFPIKISDEVLWVRSTEILYDTDYKEFKLEWQFFNETGPISLIYNNSIHDRYYFNMRNLRYAIISDARKSDLGLAIAFDGMSSINSSYKHVWRLLIDSNNNAGLGLDYNDIAADGRVGIIASLVNPLVADDVNVRDRRKEIEELLKDLEDDDEVDILPQAKNEGLVEPYPIPRDIPVDKVIDKSIPKDVVQDIELPDFPDLPSFNTSPKIAHKFPFSIPFDIMAGIKLLAVNPTTPVFEIPIKFESKAFKFDKTIVLDFDFIAPIAKFSRWLFTIIFVLFLALGTRRLIMG